MINLQDYEIFRNHQDTLKRLSKDDSNPEDVQFVTESGRMAIDFDTVKQKYANLLGHSEDDAASVDAIVQGSNRLLFVEFKNGKVKNQEIRNKLFDSLLIFGDITKQTVADTREYAEFVVVYNKEENPLPNQITKNLIQDSPSREAIGSYFSEKAGMEYILFGLCRYEGLYFKRVHTYDAEKFKSYIDDFS